MKTICFSIAFLVALFANAKETTREFFSQKERTPLIELFSSEGCSSCPPAEKKISSLRDRADLWKKFVPVNFHVDYWNNLGWVDPYSNEKFTERQHRYAEAWGVRSVYTPAFVFNGESTSTELTLDSAGKPSSVAGPVPSIQLSVNKKNEMAVVCRNLGAGKEYEIHAVLLGNGLISDVKAGENKGRRLIQNFAVLDYTITSLKSGQARTQLAVNGSKVKPESLAIAAWVTEKSKMVPLQSVGGYL